MYVVYKHTCPNGKVYIGISSNYSRRCVPGNYRHNIRWTNAINKYGWDNIKHEILFENLTKEEACQKEIELIAKYNSTDIRFGYNINLGGNIPFSYGKHLTEEHKQNLSKANKGRKASAEAVEKNRLGHLGKQHSEETKSKMSKAHLGKHTGENNGMYGKDPWNKGKKITLTQEQFDKASKAHTKIMTLYQYDLDFNLINTFTTYKEASEATGIPVRSITNNACGYQKSAYGYIFKKENNYMEKYQEALNNVYNELKNYLDKVNIQETNIKFISCLYEAKNEIQAALMPTLIIREELADMLKETLDKIYATLPTKEEIAYWQEYQRNLFNELKNRLYSYEKLMEV